MLQEVSKSISERILICALFGRDGELIEREVGRAGLTCIRYSSVKNLCTGIRDGAGAALVCDYAFGNGDMELLTEVLASQPTWSELPVLVLTSGGGTTVETRSVLRALEPVGNLTLLERPLRPDTLVSSVRSALRARRHQYRIRDSIRRLKESETTLQTYLDNTGDGIYVLDSHTGRILNTNKRAADMLGYGEQELLRLSVSDIERGPTAAALHDFSCGQKQGQPVQLQGVNQRKDGSGFPVEVHLTSLAPALPDQVLAVMRDITERKRAENERAEEARRKDEFLALLGHEMRNPLAAISTALTALSGKCTPDQREELQKATARQVVLMRRLLDDLLDLSRGSRGQLELKKEAIDLTEFLQKAAETVRPTVTERRQKLVVRVPGRPVRFMADRARLEQIATNLLDNASKYSGGGGRIEFSGAREGAEIVLRCKDNGQGILRKHIGRIFEPFIRGVNERDSYGEASMGIGLALVKQLVQLHDGTISVESDGPGKGSQFTVRIPLVAPKSRIISPKTTAAPASQESKSIVVVEDNPTVASAMKTALEQAGHQVHVFRDGPSALAGVDRLTPDAVLLDIGLPGMNGHEVAAKLKKKRKVKDALFIAVSGFDRRLLAEKDGGHFDHYFIKPLEMKTLLALLGMRSGAGAKRDATKKPAGKNRSRLRVLVVDDYPLVADATAQLLQEEGADARTAHSGREALQVAKSFRPQLILCDMRLGDMKGLDVIRELRSDPSTKEIHAIIMTGLSGSEIREFNRRAKDFGVNKFISKPIEPKMIRKLVTNLTPQ